MIIKTEQELHILRECGKRLAQVLKGITKKVQPSISTKELDMVAETLILQYGGEPIFKGYQTDDDKWPFPASLCVSVNEEIVHGIPSGKRILREGDIVGLDIGMRWPAVTTNNQQPTTNNGLITDMAVTIGVGKISAEAEKLLRITHESLDKGIAMLRSGARIGNLGHKIQSHIESHGFGVVRELVGHGVGKHLHEDPMIPNFGKRGTGRKLIEKEVIAIEPMATLGDYHISLSDDGWTFKTRDNSLAAHFEYTVVIWKDKAEVLTKV